MMKEGYDKYYLTDRETWHRDPEPWIMHQEQKKLSNEFLERQHSRCRWMTDEEFAASRSTYT